MIKGFGSYKMNIGKIININARYDNDQQQFNRFQAITFINNVDIIFIVAKIKTQLDSTQLNQQCITSKFIVEKISNSISILIANNNTST